VGNQVKFWSVSKQASVRGGNSHLMAIILQSGNSDILTTNSMKTVIYFKLMRIVVTVAVVTAVEVFLLITMLVILEKTILLEAIQLWQLMSTRRG
jgi:hypothetical protein